MVERGGTGTTSECGFEQFKAPNKVSIRPTLKDLQHWITPQYAPCWRELGIQLGVTNETLSIIQEDSPHSVTKRCNAMLTKWLEVDDTSASWRKLFTAIDNSTYQRLNDNQDNTGPTDHEAHLQCKYLIENARFKSEQEERAPGHSKHLTILKPIQCNSGHSTERDVIPTTEETQNTQLGDIDIQAASIGQSQEQFKANKDMVATSKGCQNSYNGLTERLPRTNTNRTFVFKGTSISLAYCHLLALILVAVCCSLVLNHAGSNTASPAIHQPSPVMKTPISKLQEYCQQNKLTPPSYNEFQVSGGFYFVVTVRGKQYSGETRSKKQEAKHSAAEAALQQLYTSTISVSFVKELKEKYFDKNKIVFKKDNYFTTTVVDGGYQCTLHIDENVFTSGKCQSKSEAENEAAEQALKHFKL